MILQNPPPLQSWPSDEWVVELWLLAGPWRGHPTELTRCKPP